jgi:hypothetical protein
MTLTLGQELRLLALRSKRGKADISKWFSRAVADAEAQASAKTFAEAVAKHIRHLFEGSPEADFAGGELGKRGWTVPGWATYDQIKPLARTPSSHSLDAFFVRQYRRPGLLSRVTSQTAKRPLMLRWLPLYRQATFLVNRRQHLVAVPALLLTFEGLVVTAVEAAKTNVRPRQVLRELTARQSGSLRASWLSLAAFANTVFGDHHFSGQRPQIMNRHWIVHGRTAPRWNRADALRMLQAIDTASSLMQLVARPTRAA